MKIEIMSNDSKIVDKSLCVAGSYIETKYIQCPHSKKCKWKMDNNHSKGYSYLNNACYLSGSFKLDCPK